MALEKKLLDKQVRMGGKEEMKTIVDINGSEKINSSKDPPQSGEFNMWSSDEFRIFTRTICTKKSIKPFIMTLMAIVTGLIIVLPFLILPACVLYFIPGINNHPNWLLIMVIGYLPALFLEFAVPIFVVYTAIFSFRIFLHLYTGIFQYYNSQTYF